MMGKTGIVMILLLLAVACMGGVAAGFGDELDVDATATTGTMQYEITGWAETWAYSYVEEGVPGVLVLDEPAAPDLFPPELYLPAGAADIDDREPGMLLQPDADTKEMSVTFALVVPGIDYRAGVFIRYTGTVPARMELDYLEFHGDEALEGLVTTRFFVQEEPDSPWEEVAADALQLHEGDMLEVSFTARSEALPGAPPMVGSLETAFIPVQWYE